MKTTKETLQSLLERYKVYAGEYKKPADLVQEIILSGDLPEKEHDPRIGAIVDNQDVVNFLGWSQESIDLFVEIFDLFDRNYQKQEFLIHKECFHPSFDLYYACPDTTSAEFVYVIQECLNSL